MALIFAESLNGKCWVITFLLRGFGFVTFADPESIEKVLKVGRHEIDEKMVRDKKSCIIVVIMLMKNGLWCMIDKSYNFPSDRSESCLPKEVHSQGNYSRLRQFLCYTVHTRLHGARETTPTISTQWRYRDNLWFLVLSNIWAINIQS